MYGENTEVSSSKEVFITTSINFHRTSLLRCSDYRKYKFQLCVSLTGVNTAQNNNINSQAQDTTTLKRSAFQQEYNVLMTNEIHNPYNQFLFHSFLSALHVSNESSRSSSGARHNVLHYTVWYNRYNRADESSCFKAAARLYRLYQTV